MEKSKDYKVTEQEARQLLHNAKSYFADRADWFYRHGKVSGGANAESFVELGKIVGASSVIFLTGAFVGALGLFGTAALTVLAPGLVPYLSGLTNGAMSTELVTNILLGISLLPGAGIAIKGVHFIGETLFELTKAAIDQRGQRSENRDLFMKEMKEFSMILDKDLMEAGQYIYDNYDFALDRSNPKIAHPSEKKITKFRKIYYKKLLKEEKRVDKLEQKEEHYRNKTNKFKSDYEKYKKEKEAQNKPESLYKDKKPKTFSEYERYMEEKDKAAKVKAAEASAKEASAKEASAKEARAKAAEARAAETKAAQTKEAETEVNEVSADVIVKEKDNPVESVNKSNTSQKSLADVFREIGEPAESRNENADKPVDKKPENKKTLAEAFREIGQPAEGSKKTTDRPKENSKKTADKPAESSKKTADKPADSKHESIFGSVFEKEDTSNDNDGRNK